MPLLSCRAVPDSRTARTSACWPASFPAVRVGVGDAPGGGLLGPAPAGLGRAGEAVNRVAFGKPGSSRDEAIFPQVQLTALIEVGMRGPCPRILQACQADPARVWQRCGRSWIREALTNLPADTQAIQS